MFSEDGNGWGMQGSNGMSEICAARDVYGSSDNQDHSKTAHTLPATAIIGDASVDSSVSLPDEKMSKLSIVPRI